MARGTWWERAGLESDPGRGWLGIALRLWHTAARRAPTEADQPSVSVLPMTPAAREAVRIRREQTATERGKR